jgi:hypothetical protein
MLKRKNKEGTPRDGLRIVGTQAEQVWKALIFQASFCCLRQAWDEPQQRQLFAHRTLAILINEHRDTGILCKNFEMSETRISPC